VCDYVLSLLSELWYLLDQVSEINFHTPRPCTLMGQSNKRRSVTTITTTIISNIVR
jgi:hypothetical protein